MTTEQLWCLPGELQNSEVQITDTLDLVALAEQEYEAVMLFISHSCEPDVGFAGNVVLVAMRDIDAGEELTTGYVRRPRGVYGRRVRAPDMLRAGDGRDWKRPELQERY